MFLKKPFFIMLLSMLSSCASIQDKTALERLPADRPVTCHELAQSFFMKENYNQDLNKALIEKKLLSFSNKFVTVEHPSMNWLNNARISLNKSIKNWNNNKYPAFYIFSDEEVVPAAKKYFRTMVERSKAGPDLDETATENFELIQSWIKSYQNYHKDVDQLLEERISLQYNLTLLKKIKLKDDPRDIKLSVMRGGQLVNEIVTLRSSDKDLDYQLKKFKSELQEFDGSLLKNGRIKDRIIRQAALADILTIVQREFEYALKNSEGPSIVLRKELDNLNTLINQADLRATTYGIYRITNQIFIRELVALSKLDLAYKKFVQAPVMKLADIVQEFIENRQNTNAKKPAKIGVFKRIYAKISHISAKQASIGGSALVIAGIGFERYFSVVGEPVVEEERAHEMQIERSEEEAIKQSEEHSSVIEIHIDELANGQAHQ